MRIFELINGNTLHTLKCPKICLFNPLTPRQTSPSAPSVASEAHSLWAHVCALRKGTGLSVSAPEQFPGRRMQKATAQQQIQDPIFCWSSHAPKADSRYHFVRFWIDFVSSPCTWPTSRNIMPNSEEILSIGIIILECRGGRTYLIYLSVHK